MSRAMNGRGPMRTIDNLKKTAKRWLKALRARDAEAVARLQRAHPRAPAEPGLRDVQHALARERGFESWNDLQRATLERVLTARNAGGAVASASPLVDSG